MDVREQKDLSKWVWGKTGSRRVYSRTQLTWAQRTEVLRTGKGLSGGQGKRTRGIGEEDEQEHLCY